MSAPTQFTVFAASLPNSVSVGSALNVHCYEGDIVLVLISTVRFIALKVYVDSHTDVVFFTMKYSFQICNLTS